MHYPKLCNAGLALIPECRCRTDAADYRPKRPMPEYPFLAFFSAFTYDLSTHKVSLTHHHQFCLNMLVVFLSTTSSMDIGHGWCLLLLTTSSMDVQRVFLPPVVWTLGYNDFNNLVMQTL
jgi:hypothetical protein